VGGAMTLVRIGRTSRTGWGHSGGRAAVHCMARVAPHPLWAQASKGAGRRGGGGQRSRESTLAKRARGRDVRVGCGAAMVAVTGQCDCHSRDVRLMTLLKGAT
jgi:hypothetical protein